MGEKEDREFAYEYAKEHAMEFWCSKETLESDVEKFLGNLSRGNGSLLLAWVQSVLVSILYVIKYVVA